VANKERGEFTLRFGDESYTLVPTTNALADFEDFTNGQTWDDLTGRLLKRGHVRDVRLLLWVFMREKHPEIASMKPESLREIGMLIDRAGGVIGVNEQLQAVLRLNSDPGGPAEGNGSRPPKAQPDARPTGGKSTRTRSKPA
jgi:hypothetical protein